MPPAIPDRWICYKACGKVIEGTRIICFKVPLKKNIQIGNKEVKQIWDINSLLKTIKSLGAVIDLTNTNRYYDPRDLQAAGVQHKKILMPGRILPPENKVKEASSGSFWKLQFLQKFIDGNANAVVTFMDAVDHFLGRDRDFLIGVHCTHGLNRTGYMVCRYMRDRLGIPAKDAIKRFEIARGYQMERENYIAHLLEKPDVEPDLSKDTYVKPVNKRKHNFTYRSPLEQCGYEDYQSGSRYTHRNKSNERRDVDREDRSKRRKRDSGSSFNYKYDY